MDVLESIARDASLQQAATLYLGLAIGGLVTVISSRLRGVPGGSLADALRRSSYPGSHCPVCGHALALRDVIPVLGFVLCGGHCRHCGVRIPLRYPALELCAAAAVAAMSLPAAGTPLFWPIVLIAASTATVGGFALARHRLCIHGAVAVSTATLAVIPWAEPINVVPLALGATTVALYAFLSQRTNG